MRARYLADLADRPKFTRKIKAVVACGNGTAGAFAPDGLAALGVDVVPLDTELDWTFPRYNPNPEDLKMLHAIADAVRASGADIGLGFDGDGDRCGVIDETGAEIFADKVGVLIARDLSARHKGATFVVDVKSTGLYATDPVLAANGATTDYWKTGHSYIKRRVRDLQALAGFEKSGHYFLNPPIGRGYDDGLLSAIAILDLLDRNPAQSLSALAAGLARTWSSPTMSAECPDEEKYGVADAVTARFQALRGIGRDDRRPRDRRSRHRQWRARGHRRRHLGSGARLVQQARAGRGGREPGVGSAHARDVRRRRRLHARA